MSFNSSKISALTGAAGATGATGASGSGSGDVVKSGSPGENQVGIWTSGGTLEGDSTLIFDGDNLGIGAGSDPDHPLHVGTDDFIVKSDGKVGIGCTPINRFNVQVGTDHRIGMWGASTYSAIQSVNDDNSAVKDLRFDASEFWFMGGNVGIGTVVPSTDIGFTRILHLSHANAVGIKFEATNYNAWEIGTGTSSNFIIADGGIGRINIDSSGNVGIGTSVPEGTCHIHTGSAGSVTADASANDLIVESSSNCGISLLSPDLSQIYFGTPSLNGSAHLRWTHSESEFKIGTGLANGELVFLSGANAERMRITSDGDVKIAESLGVGGIPTAAPLHVFSTGTQPATFESTHSSNRARIELLPASGGNAFLISEGGYLSIGGASSLSASNLNIGVVGGGAGNVGIGTDSPGHRLELGENTSGGSTTENLISQWSATRDEGDLDFTITLHDTTDQAVGTGSGIRFSARYTDAGTGSAGAAGIDAYKESAASGNYAFAMRFHTRPDGEALTERMRITSGGQVSQPVETTTTASVDTGGGSYDASYVIDFTKSNYQELLLDSGLNNELVLTVTGAAAGRTVKLFVRPDPDDPGAGLMTVTLPAWKESGADVSSGGVTTFLLELTAWGAGAGDITATTREMV